MDVCNVTILWKRKGFKPRYMSGVRLRLLAINGGGKMGSPYMACGAVPSNTAALTVTPPTHLSDKSLLPLPSQLLSFLALQPQPLFIKAQRQFALIALPNRHLPYIRTHL